jgi:hypothetical protein
VVTLVRSGSYAVLVVFWLGRYFPKGSIDALIDTITHGGKTYFAKIAINTIRYISSKVEDFNLCVVHTVHILIDGHRAYPTWLVEVLETWAMCTEASKSSSGSNTSEVALPNP